MRTTAILLLFVLMPLSFAQTAAKKPLPEKTDAWERSKECAAQAEKLMGDTRYWAAKASSYLNHYSPKYNRCFIEVYQLPTEVIKGAPVSRTSLVDAYERSVVANTAIGADPVTGCRNESDRETCEKLARILWESSCQIDYKTVGCDTSKDFIVEHMKN